MAVEVLEAARAATHNGVQASEGGTDGQTGEARLCDGRVDDPLLAEAVEEALGDLVTAAPSAPIVGKPQAPCSLR